MNLQKEEALPPAGVYQPNNHFLCLTRSSKAKGLVSMSAGCSSVSIFSKEKGASSLEVCSRKWKHLMGHLSLSGD